MLLLKDIEYSLRQPDGSPLPILDVPEFHVGAGKQMVLVGPSGCGKTTLLHVIAGINRPDQGQVRINQMDIGLISEAEGDRFHAQHIGYVIQAFYLRRGYTALENVLLSGRGRGIGRLSPSTEGRVAHCLLEKARPRTRRCRGRATR
jgi:ABC-type lipoprotein export system ATPase subunit